MIPLTFICWRWKPNPGYRSRFGPEMVRILRNMVKRNYQYPHRFVCVCDRPHEIDKDIETMPIWSEWADIQSPHGAHNPSCYRRLRVFGPDAERLFGPRFVSMDLDTVIVADIAPLFDRPEEFVCYGETDHRSFYNGSMFMLKAGARRQVYDMFAANPEEAKKDARKNGRFGSDQSILSNVLGKGEAIWTAKDGVLSYRIDLKDGTLPLPKTARVVHFHGGTDPDSPRAQRLDWVRRHYV